MKVNHEPRQRTVSFKITNGMERVLIAIRLRMSQRKGETVTKTDVMEEAIRLLAKKEKVEIDAG